MENEIVELCPICWEKPSEYNAGCGHNYCLICLLKINKCGLCRKELIKIKLCNEIKIKYLSIYGNKNNEPQYVLTNDNRQINLRTLNSNQHINVNNEILNEISNEISNETILNAIQQASQVRVETINYNILYYVNRELWERDYRPRNEANRQA